MNAKISYLVYTEAGDSGPTSKAYTFEEALYNCAYFILHTEFPESTLTIVEL